MTLEEEYQSIRQQKKQNIYEIAIQAGLKGAPWEFSRKDNRPIPPSDNVYQNSLWTFGGKGEPYLACIWWNEITPFDGKLVRLGNSRLDAQKWGNMKTDMTSLGASAPPEQNDSPQTTESCLHRIWTRLLIVASSALMIISRFSSTTNYTFNQRTPCLLMSI